MRRLLRAISLGIAPALVVCLAHAWTTEDAFIDFRVVQHLLAGHGPVFNAGERVEAYTNPIWVAILALVDAPLRPLLGDRVPLEWTALILGLAATVAGVLLAEIGAMRLARSLGRRGPPLPLGAIAFAILPALWSFSTSGLETGLSFGWIGLCFWETARLPRGRRWFPLVAGLGTLIRPDLGVYAVGFLVAAIAVDDRGWRARARMVAGWAALPLAYQIFRMGYFASLVPSTAIAKEASLARWDQGYAYLVDFLAPYHLGWPFAIVALVEAALIRSAIRAGGGRRARALAAILAPTISALVHAAYVVRVGGDFMHARFLLPAWFALLAPVSAVPVRGARALPVAAMIPWALACALWFRVPYIGPGRDGIGPQGIADEHFYYAGRFHAAPVTIDDYGSHGWTREGRRLRAIAGKRRVVIIPNDHAPRGKDKTYELPLVPGVPANVVSLRAHVGLLGYAAGLGVHPLDRLGLGDAMAAHITLGRRGRPGHEKWLDPAWALARFARGPSFATGPWGPPVSKVMDARAALGCGDLAVMMEAITAPLTLRRFVENLLLAPRLTRFRFPNDATAARAALCPRGS